MSAQAPGPLDSGAILDLSRRERLGMVEAVWGEHKSTDQIVAIVQELLNASETVLVTRVDRAKAEAVLSQLPAGALHYQVESRCLHSPLQDPDPSTGRVAVLTGGSSDLAVAAEAHLALGCHGIACTLQLDVGVAGLHRLLERLDALRKLHHVEWRWVKGHAGDPGNERADMLANKGVASISKVRAT